MLQMRCCLPALCVLSVLAAPVFGAEVPLQTQVLEPQQLAPDAPIANPFSGLYTGLFQNPRTLALQPVKATNAAPWPARPVDVYGRVSWHSLEAAGAGKFDFSVIDKVLAALPKGDRFGFRVMAFNPQQKSDTNLATGADGYPVYTDVPAYLETRDHGWLLPLDPQDATQGHYFIPDWNDPYVQQRMAALVAALGRAYDGDPRMGWVDIGLYGSWGEWHTAGLPDSADYKWGIPYGVAAPYFSINQQQYLSNKGVAGAYAAGTAASKTQIVQAYASAFPKTQLLMLTDDGDAVCYALTLAGQRKPIGLRRDSLGSSINSFYWQFPDALPGCNTAGDIQAILARWRTAPFVTEAYGNGASPTFPCQTFEQVLPADRSRAYNCSVAGWNGAVPNYCIDEEVLATHVASIKNASLCSTDWSTYPAAEQQAFLTAGLYAGYRFAPARVAVTADRSGAGTLSVETSWLNRGVTPAYDAWQVRYSLWLLRRGQPAPALTWTSAVDLRQVLPTGAAPFAPQTPLIVRDTVVLPPTVPSGTYELQVEVADPTSYLAPMQLALEGRFTDGRYSLGKIAIPEPSR
ncbi:hypothetical protein GCM10011611_00480 [Aliidongia dinghuensis]|uniref:DUF4832 domain-containing protein n=1 Tax=Aliidongia dinghuensis TaxID=1867774 RepID=A0A8J2YPB0_9PROT|nr:DUF4832 domain-containing protein [Aliidongia dinghuensis]GGE98866.1 hypothetical protein GCM10011611_00480 [Aliidongia dinghuensis]